MRGSLRAGVPDRPGDRRIVAVGGHLDRHEPGRLRAAGDAGKEQGDACREAFHAWPFRIFRESY
jgi:hypothetical protein